MAISEQTVEFISIEKLKNLKNLEKLPLNEKPLTAILGVNGSGKSTILHALACCYRVSSAPLRGSDHQFMRWFAPTPDATWQGSKFTLQHSYRNGDSSHPNSLMEFEKISDRWTPRTDRRVERHVALIGIHTCVPKIEDEKISTAVKYTTETMATAVSEKVRNAASEIMEKSYTEFNQHKVSKTKTYMGVKGAGIKYSALSMGAGEQRLFRILETVYAAPKYSLILIDEIDLLLHTNALHLLLRKLDECAKKNKLQIVFTTHRESIHELDSFISIKHIHQTNERTFFISDPKPETMRRLTGVTDKPLEIWVEDDVSRAIVNHVINAVGLRRYTSVALFGSSENCFTLAAARVINGSASSEVLYLLDGDVYETDELKLERIKKTLTGTETAVDSRRSEALSMMQQLNAPDKFAPEQVLVKFISGLASAELNPESQETYTIVMRHVHKADAHHIIGATSDDMAVQREEALRRLTGLAALSTCWNEYTQAVHSWLEERKIQLHEQLN